MRLDKPTTPTLIMHGSEDRCTPLGQAQEFYAALRRARRRQPSSSSIRARAMASRSAAIGCDAWRRTVAWFDRYLGTRSDERRAASSASSCGGSPSPCRCCSSSPSASSRWSISRPATRCARCSARGRPIPATLAALRERYHLNDPFIVQYGKWLWQVLQGDLGRSINGNRLVLSTITRAAGVTIFLGLMSTFIVLVVGILLGMLAALPPRLAARPGGGHVRRLRHLARRPSSPASSCSMSSASCSAGSRPSAPGRGFLDRLWHLTLPAVALALSVMAIVVKITRAAMIEELDKDYVVFARARGLSRRAHHLRLRAAQRAHPRRHRRRPHRRRPARQRDLCRGDLRACRASAPSPSMRCRSATSR